MKLPGTLQCTGKLSFTLTKKAKSALSRVLTLDDLGFKRIFQTAMLKIDSNRTERKQGKQLEGC